MAIFDGFFDNFASGVLNPKGNLADWRHASRLFVDEKMKFAPKTKFLYHVQFTLSEPAKQFIPGLDKFSNTIGGLVYSSDLPTYTAQVETRNKYNRKKNFQTSLEYNPITIEFFDDNFGATTKLLESYYKYYFADSFQTLESGAFGDTHGRSISASGTTSLGGGAPPSVRDIGPPQKAGQTLTGDTLYSPGFNEFKFGMDNNLPAIPFFTKIEISQLARRSYNTYTLVRPILTEWNHDSVDSGDNSTAMKNSITVRYEAVLYSAGDVEAGNDGEPTGFGDPAHYDNTPSPISVLGGGQQGVLGIIGGAGDVLGGEYGLAGGAVAGFNLVQSAQNLTTEGVIEEGLNLATSALSDFQSPDIGGLPNTFFPKNRGQGGQPDITEAAPNQLPDNLPIGDINTGNAGNIA